MPRLSTDPGLSANKIDVLSKRESHGWFITTVASGLGRARIRVFIGLYHEFGHPEVILFGLSKPTLHRLINDLGERIRNGAKYKDGERVLG